MFGIGECIHDPQNQDTVYSCLFRFVRRGHLACKALHLFTHSHIHVQSMWTNMYSSFIFARDRKRRWPIQCFIPEGLNRGSQVTTVAASWRETRQRQADCILSQAALLLVSERGTRIAPNGAVRLFSKPSLSQNVPKQGLLIMAGLI